MTTEAAAALPRARSRHAVHAATVRWRGHTPAVVKITDLTPPQARLVKALVLAARAENERAAAAVASPPGTE